MLGEAAIRRDDEPVEISKDELAAVGVLGIVSEKLGGEQIVAAAQVCERRSERPPVSVSEPGWIERSARRVAGGERGTSGALIRLGDEHAAPAEQVADVVVESKQKLDRAGVGRHFTERNREPAGWRDHPGRDQDGMESTVDELEIETALRERVELVVREVRAHGWHPRTLGGAFHEGKREPHLVHPCGATQTRRVEHPADLRRLDHGHAFAVGPDDHPGFALDVRVCSAVNCACTDVELALLPRERLGRSSDGADEADDDVESVSVQFNARTREVRRISDPADWLTAPADERWLRGELAGAVGDRIVARVDRLRASHDRRTWQSFAWADHQKGDKVAHYELFPHDWDLLVMPDERTAWAIDYYCVEPSCSCQDIAISLRAEQGATIGEATLRLGSRAGLIVIHCTPEARPYVDKLVQHQHRALLRRFGEMRSIARRLKTWPQDLADPTAAVETLLARRAPLEVDDLDRIHALGERVVAQLVAAAQDPGANEVRRKRATQLLAAIGDPAAVDVLAAAVRWADPEVDPDVFDEVSSALNEIRGPSLAALLAVLPTTTSDAERERVAFALADLRIADPRVLALVAEYVRRAPRQWLHHLQWQGDEAIPIAREALASALDAGLEHLEVAIESADILRDLGATVDAEHRARIGQAQQAAADLEADRAARARADADTARAELAAFDRRVRPGRNQACPCGSGEKYKKCHLAADETTRSELVRRTLG